MKQILKIRKIIPSITTTNEGDNERWSDWEAQIKEINELGLEEVAIFPTCLKKEEREKLYQLLGSSSIKSVPFVHLRTDMALDELKYLVKNYKTKFFCIHSQAEFPLIYDYSEYREKILIENVYRPLDENEIKDFGGLCLDMAHLENDRLLNKEKFEQEIKIIEKYAILSNHISVVKKVARTDKEGKIRYDSHNLENLSELDYLKKYPKNYFSPLITIELENSIKEQLKARDYILKLIRKN